MKHIASSQACDNTAFYQAWLTFSPHLWPLSFVLSSDQGCLLKYPFQNSLTFHWLFPVFRTFSRILFRRQITAILIHQQFENLVKIFMLADFIFKEKSQTKNIRKRMNLNINYLQFIENIISRCLFTINFLGFFFTFPGFFFTLSIFPWLKVKFPDFSFTWKKIHFPDFFPPWLWQP